jgi:outer membrane lipoprotein SlyB
MERNQIVAITAIACVGALTYLAAIGKIEGAQVAALAGAIIGWLLPSPVDKPPVDK